MFEFSPIKGSSQQAFSSTQTPNCPTTLTPVKENEPSVCRQLSYNDIETNEINCAITPPIVTCIKYNSRHATLLSELFGDYPRFVLLDELHRHKT